MRLRERFRGKEPQTIGQYTPFDFQCDILVIVAGGAGGARTRA